MHINLAHTHALTHEYMNEEHECEIKHHTYHDLQCQDQMWTGQKCVFPEMHAKLK